jgi:hypothetical protein
MEAAQKVLQRAKLAGANPTDPCEGKDQSACDALDECTWCKSAAVPSSCYTRVIIIIIIPCKPYLSASATAPHSLGRRKVE